MECSGTCFIATPSVPTMLSMAQVLNFAWMEGNKLKGKEGRKEGDRKKGSRRRKKERGRKEEWEERERRKLCVKIGGREGV